MRRGLVLGKFMPLHTGHIELIEFGASKCDELIVWLCVSDKETMPAELRKKWIEILFAKRPEIKIVLFQYKESELPNTSESSEDISRLWSDVIKSKLPKIDVIFSTENYGDYVAYFLGIQHQKFPDKRTISATEIRSNPYRNWHYLPECVKPYYFKKVVILGSESTGKSTLTQKLAQHYQSDYVSEVGRAIVEDSRGFEWEDLQKIAEQHALNIIEKAKLCNKLLLIDTDIHITKSYAKFAFQRELEVADWINEANKADLYIYLWNDAPHIQDGTRLSEANRNLLHESHLKVLQESNIEFVKVRGTWAERCESAVKSINKALGFKNC